MHNMKYPDYVTSFTGQILFRFLSNLADHFNKNTFWIKGQYGLYLKRFSNVPTDYLKMALQDYLMNELEWLPTIKIVTKYMHARSDFKQHWHSVPLGQSYCEHCRTDSEGKEGGFREIFFYGYRQTLQRKATAHYKGACTCELASKSVHQSYIEIVDWMRKQDQFAEICVSYFDADQDRIITAQEQSRYYWQQKIDDGIIRIGNTEQGENDQAVYPCWEHPLWTSVFGQMMCDTYGFEMPENVRKEYEKTRSAISKYTAKRKHKKRQDSRNKIGERYYVPPMSLAEAMGAKKKDEDSKQ